MANNEYVNKVEYGGTTVMDITDTTAEAGDVIENKVFYAKSGARSVGTLGDATQSAHGLMSVADKTKLDGINLLGVKLNSSALTPDANGYVDIPVMTGATSSAAGSAGLVPAPATTDVDKFLAGDGTYKSGGLPMVILSYGKNTWAEFMEAYNNHVIVYCRASSSSNPASGQQLRMAFMAYVAGSADNPTEVEFQYYRSVNAHSATQMGDQVFVYKLTNKGVWSVTTREASVKQVNISGSGLTASWSNNQVTLSNTMTAADMPMSSSDSTTVSSAIGTNSQAIQTINNKWVNQGSSTTPVSDLGDLPINAQGYATIDASISPTGATNSFSYIKWGANGGNRYYVLATRITSSSTNAIYYCEVYDGSNNGWKELALKSDIAISSTSTIATSDWSSHHTDYINRITLQNGMVHLELMMEYESGYNLPTGTTFATVPSGYRPSNTTDVCAMIKHNSSDKWLAFMVSISSNGAMQQALTASCGGFMIDCWFPVA